jgi:hypothetical protein
VSYFVSDGITLGLWETHDGFDAYAKDWHQEGQNIKCPYNDADRLFREEGRTKDECKALCDADAACNFYSWGNSLSTHPDVCMGCQEGLWDVHDGFNGYRKEPTPEPTPVQEVRFEINVAATGLTVAAVLNNLATYKQAIATALGIDDVDRITLTIVTSRRLVEGNTGVTLIATVTATDSDTATATETATVLATAVTEPNFVDLVETQLQTAGVTADFAVNTATISTGAASCSMTCTIDAVSNILSTQHITTSGHAFHRCYHDDAVSATHCACQCSNTAY